MDKGYAMAEHTFPVATQQMWHSNYGNNRNKFVSEFFFNKMTKIVKKKKSKIFNKHSIFIDIALNEL